MYECCMSVLWRGQSVFCELRWIVFKIRISHRRCSGAIISITIIISSIRIRILTLHWTASISRFPLPVGNRCTFPQTLSPPIQLSSNSRPAHNRNLSINHLWSAILWQFVKKFNASKAFIHQFMRSTILSNCCQMPMIKLLIKFAIMSSVSKVSLHKILLFYKIYI